MKTNKPVQVKGEVTCYAFDPNVNLTITDAKTYKFTSCKGTVNISNYSSTVYVDDSPQLIINNTPPPGITKADVYAKLQSLDNEYNRSWSFGEAGGYLFLGAFDVYDSLIVMEIYTALRPGAIPTKSTLLFQCINRVANPWAPILYGDDISDDLFCHGYNGLARVWIKYGGWQKIIVSCKTSISSTHSPNSSISQVGVTVPSFNPQDWMHPTWTK